MTPKRKSDAAIAPEESEENNQPQTASYTEEDEPVPPPHITEIIESLQGMSTIVNDDGQEIDFSGELNESFVGFFTNGYWIVERMMNSVAETGKFLTEVRDGLKPRRLFVTWLNYAGIPTSTAYQYIRLHNRYEEELTQHSQLGIKKLLAVAKLRDCKEYLRENAEEIALMPVPEVVKRVEEKLKKRPKKKGGGRKRQYEEFGKYKIRRSGNGTKLVIENLTQWEQEKIARAVKLLLSDERCEIAHIPDLGCSDDP